MFYIFIHFTLVHTCAIICIMDKRAYITIVHLYERSNKMPISYKIDVISALKSAGYSTYRIRKEKLFGEATLQKFRNGELVSWENISTLCKLLNCQPGDITEYNEDTEE